MGNHGPDVLADLRGPSRELRRLIPETYDGFSKLHHSALAAGVLDAKTKELIALAISVSHAVRRLHRLPRPRCAPAGRHRRRRWPRRSVSPC